MNLKPTLAAATLACVGICSFGVIGPAAAQNASAPAAPSPGAQAGYQLVPVQAVGYRALRCRSCRRAPLHCRCSQFTPELGPLTPLPTPPADSDAQSQSDPTQNNSAQSNDATLPGIPDDLRNDTALEPNDNTDDFVVIPRNEGMSLASVGQGANTPMLGRGDFANRLNIFDHMSAIPTTRAWGGFQALEGFNRSIIPTDNGAAVFTNTVYNTSNQTLVVDNAGHRQVTFDFAPPPNTPTPVAITLDAGFSSGNVPLSSSSLTGRQLLDTLLTADGQPNSEITQRNSESLYRYGLEVALSNDFSLTFQGQYHTASSYSATPDDFDNPQITLKYVLFRDDRSTTSAVLALQPETGQKEFSVSERTTRFYPGMLGYRSLSSDLFMQWGVQASLPTDGSYTTAADWAVSFGYWLYRYNNANRRRNRPFVVGVVPQVELLGHHVLGDTTVEGAYGIPTSSSSSIFGPLGGDNSALYVYEEDRNVVDLTGGVQVLLRSRMQLGFAASIPITGASVRDSEFISTVSFLR